MAKREKPRVGEVWRRGKAVRVVQMTFETGNTNDVYWKRPGAPDWLVQGCTLRAWKNWASRATLESEAANG